MLPRNYLINSATRATQNIIPTSSVYHSLVVTEREQQAKQKQKLRRRTTDTTIAIASTSFFSVNTTNINSTISSSSSTSSTQQQQISFEDSYSAKTGIKTAALLGGMLLLVIIYLIWKSRARLFRSIRSRSTALGNPRLSGSKFDLDYWLKQVDLLEAKEAERHRGGQSPYLELPKLEARDNRQATASWITDAYRHWRLRQFRQQHRFLRQDENQPPETPSVPYQRRRNLLRRLVRRFLTSSRQHSSFFMEQSPALIAGMRTSVVSNSMIPLPLAPGLQPRRTASWPHLKSSHHQAGIPMSALQTHLARKRLLKRTSRTTLEM